MAIPLNGTTIYAQWTVNKYKITYVGNGGTTPAALEANYGSSITMATSTRAPYTFDGWYTAATGGTKVDHKTMPLNSATVYAQWKLTIGTEVTVGGEKFFVIEECAHDTANVKLLSKFNLNQAGTQQVDAAMSQVQCAFSSSPYWTSNEENLNNDNAPAGSAYQKAKAYGMSKGCFGCLLQKSEVEQLRSVIPDVLDCKGTGFENRATRFWLATSKEGGNVYVWGGSNYNLSSLPYSYTGRIELLGIGPPSDYEAV